MKFLLSGFEPFDKSPINPSEQVVHSLAQEIIPGVQLETVVLPVDFELGPSTLIAAVESTQPEAVLCLGQASRRTAISIERVAVNLLDFRIPDNTGNQFRDQPVVAGGPAAYFVTLPVRDIYDELRVNCVPAELSLSAGAFICNQVIYALLHHLHSRNLSVPAGFIHLPDLPEQAAKKSPSGPSMSLDTMTRGIRLALQVIARG